ncbi:MAG: DnaJ C-terminal domain-containing protein [Bacteroidota bacterium]
MNVTIPKGIDSGKALRLKGLGMPNYQNSNQTGNLFVQVKVVTPRNLTAEEEKLLKKLQAIRSNSYSYAS